MWEENTEGIFPGESGSIFKTQKHENTQKLIHENMKIKNENYNNRKI